MLCNEPSAPVIIIEDQYLQTFLHTLDGVISKIKNAMQSAVLKLQTKLMKSDVKKAGTEQIKAMAKASILSKLASAKAAAKQISPERQNEKANMQAHKVCNINR